jgi:recombination protein RecA
VEERPALTRLIAAAQRRWGVRALRQGADAAAEHLTLPTGHAALDALLSGGFPRGAVTELLGTPTSGMTTLALTALAQSQARGEVGAYIDLSTTFDAAYAAACGVQLRELLLVRPTSAAEALELVEALLSSGGIGALVVDALTWLAGTPNGSSLIASAMRRLTTILPHQPGALIALTVLPYPAAIAERLRTHPSPLAHAAALRLQITRAAWESAGSHPGCQAHVAVLKRRGAADGGGLELSIAFPNDWEVR